MLLMLFIQQFFMIADAKILVKDFTFRLLDFIFLLGGTALFFGLMNISQIMIVIFAVLLLILYVFINTRNIKVSLVVTTFSYSINVVMDHIIDILIKLLNIEKIDLNYLLLFVVSNVIVLYLVYLTVKNNSSKKELKFSNFETLIITITLIMLCSLIIFTEIISSSYFEILIYNLIIATLGLIAITYIFRQRMENISKEYEIRNKEIQIKKDNRYIKEMEKHYNELRKFRHDYQNIMLSLDEYIRTDDIEGLKNYYNNSIKKISDKMISEKYTLEDISRIKNKEIKSILFNKLYTAQMSGIKVTFESETEVTNFYANTLDLAIALGIILDNAIEETQNQDEGSIVAGVMKDENSIMIVVQNSIRSDTPPVWKMKSPGFSTKGNNRGMGLVNLSEIINQNNNVTLETMKTNGYFFQKLNIDIRSLHND